MEGTQSIIDYMIASQGEKKTTRKILSIISQKLEQA